MGQFFIFHRFFETRGLLPEKTFPSSEISTLEESMFQNTFNTTKCLDHISTIMVQVPQLTIVTVMSPPERILFQNLILLEILTNSPTLIISQSQSILLEESIDTRNTVIPTFHQFINSQSSILGKSFLLLKSIFSPNSLGI